MTQPTDTQTHRQAGQRSSSSLCGTVEGFLCSGCDTEKIISLLYAAYNKPDAFRPAGKVSHDDLLTKYAPKTPLEELNYKNNKCKKHLKIDFMPQHH